MSQNSYIENPNIVKIEFSKDETYSKNLLQSSFGGSAILAITVIN